MGMWVELGLFFVVIAFGFYQLHDVKKAQQERMARETAAKPSATAFSETAADAPVDKTTNESTNESPSEHASAHTSTSPTSRTP